MTLFSSIVRQTPEDRELKKKQEELKTMESELAQKELDLATLLGELHSFEGRYLHIVGTRYSKLDEMEARILEAMAYQKPDDPEIQEQAAQARARAQESSRDAGITELLKDTKEFQPSESLKQLYRQVAKVIHPDLTTDEEERTRRQRIMAEANRAYEQGDENKLLSILHEWESCPESVKGDGPGAGLVRVIRKIAQVEDRLCSIEDEIACIKGYDLYQLKIKVDDAKKEGRDFLNEMALQIEKQISDAQKRLNQII